MPTATRTRPMLDVSGAAVTAAEAAEAAERAGHPRRDRRRGRRGRPARAPAHRRRTDGAQTASVEVGIDKARTAAILVRPSREIEEQVSSGRLGAAALHGAAALAGGVPPTVDGEVVGAIGTSGGTPDEDESVSLLGAAAAFSAPGLVVEKVHVGYWWGPALPLPVCGRTSGRRSGGSSGLRSHGGRRPRGVARGALIHRAGPAGRARREARGCARRRA